MKHFQWTVTGTDRQDHTVTLETDFFKNRFDIEVDGAPFPVKASRRHYIHGFAKHTVSVGGKTCHLMAHGTRADLAVDGRFIDCRLPYVPFPPIPKFLRLYMILCAFACLVCGFLSLPIGLTGVVRCSRTATCPFLTKDAKRKTCGITTLIVWVLSLAVALLVAVLA